MINHRYVSKEMATKLKDAADSYISVVDELYADLALKGLIPDSMSRQDFEFVSGVSMLSGTVIDSMSGVTGKVMTQSIALQITRFPIQSNEIDILLGTVRELVNSYRDIIKKYEVR